MTHPSSTPPRYLRWILLLCLGLILSLGLHAAPKPAAVKAIARPAIKAEGRRQKAENPPLAPPKRGTGVAQLPSSPAPQLFNFSTPQLPAQNLKSKIQNPPAPHSLVQSAKILYDSQRYAEASQQLGQAAEVYGAMGDYANQAQALALQSLALQKLGNWTSAQAVLDQSFSALNTDSRPPVRIRAQLFNAQGHLYLATGQNQAAYHSWQNAEQDYLAADQRSGAIGTQINQVQALESLGSYRQAGQILDDVEAHLHQIPDSVIKVKGLLKLGNMLRLRGELERSQSQLTTGLNLAQTLNRPELFNQLYLSLGNIEHILAIRTIALNPSLPNAEAQSHSWTALDYYRQAETTATASLNRVDAQLSQLRLLVQTRLYKVAASIDTTIDTTIEADTIKTLVADLQTTLPQLPFGRRAIYAHINFAHGLMTLSEQGQRYGDVQIAPMLEQVITQAEALKDERAIAHASGALGHWYETQQNWTAAKAQTHTALQKSQAIQAADIAYQWQWQLGRIIQAEADTPAPLPPRSPAPLPPRSPALTKSEAIDYYSAAIKTLNDLRSDLVALNPDVQFSFKEQVEPVYRELVGLLLREKDPGQAQLSQARDVIESLQLAELDNFFRDTCARPREVNIGSVDPTAAVFYPILLDNTAGQPGQNPQKASQRLEVILQIPNHPHLPRSPLTKRGRKIPTSPPVLPLTKGELEGVLPQKEPEQISPSTTLVHISQTFDHQDVTQIAIDLQNNLKRLSTPTGRIKSQSQQLYDWIVRPFEQELDYATDRDSSPIKTLAFVLDGPLRNLPMSVLYDGDRYLVERYAIALTPGLQLLNPQPLQRQSLNILLGGAENAPSFTSVGLGPLANVGRELDGISVTIPSSEALRDQVFLQANIQAGLKDTPFNVVHFATHGKFSSDPEQTFILDWQQRISANDMDILLRVNDPERSLETPIELLVLSACETASGDDRAALGLAGIAIRAGARSTLATLWQVNDASTTEFMVRFYKELINPNVTKADALRNAQLSFLRDSPHTRRNRPNRWAPFTLVGNWL
ncbi:MAG: CHAT domain-containing protein [Cyanobacteria bacterium P01_F01_bin.150]